MSLPIKIIAIGGPTASGKTEAAWQLAKEFNGAIISCDSRQIYREMDIATDKIQYQLPYSDPIVYQDIDHYGINLTTIDKPWTLYEWQKYARQTIKKINKKGQRPFLVGGTGLYIQAMVDNYDLHRDYDVNLRTELNQLSLQQLQDKLIKLDNDLYNSIDYHNPRRLIRAIEKKNHELHITNNDRRGGVVPPSTIKSHQYSGLVLSFIPDREIIREKITKRVDVHLKKGVLTEVENLIKKYGPADPILNSTISVQEYIPYLQGKISLEAAKKKVIINNYHYAKRQMTWFRKYGKTVFCQNLGEMRTKIKEFTR
ncbi:MAG: tRNA (adenosine(37)-N6)-dimethylallyltransferase MiaA [Patescibacteria group bacterium]